MRRSPLALLILPFLTFFACSDEHSPLVLAPGPGDPTPSGTELTLDFSEFGPGDTITSSRGVEILLIARGDNCADAVIAFDSSTPSGSTQGDDLDLGTPNQAFGGPGQGPGGEAGPHRNDRALGNLLVIQEDPTLDDGNSNPMDDCTGGGTVAFDFGALSPTGVAISEITVLDVDDQWQSRSEFRLYGQEDELLGIVNPPVTGPNGVGMFDTGGVTNVLRMELEQRVSVAVARIRIVVPAPQEATG